MRAGDKGTLRITEGGPERLIPVWGDKDVITTDTPGGKVDSCVRRAVAVPEGYGKNSG